MMLTNIPLFFDLDGTLADSLDGIATSLDHAVFKVTGKRSAQEWRAFIGPPVEVCLARALPHLDPEVISVVVREFRQHYDSVGLRMTTAYPNVHDVLAALADRGSALYIVTNKPSRAATAVADHLGFDRHVCRIVGGDTNFGRAVSSEHSKADRAAWLADEEGTHGGIFIGDGLDDLQAAERIGARFLLAEWGYGVARVLAERPKVERLSKLTDLIDYVGTVDPSTG